MPAGSAFVDTNIWIYAHLKTLKEGRHAKALALVSGLRGAVISPQVVAEYYSVMLRNGRDDRWIQTNLAAIFGYTLLQAANAALLQRALELRNRLHFSFWDCQIVAAALESGCDILYTEDLQYGQVIDDRLTVVNPFL